MRRTASEVIRNLEMRIARLEKQAEYFLNNSEEKAIVWDVKDILKKEQFPNSKTFFSLFLATLQSDSYYDEDARAIQRAVGLKKVEKTMWNWYTKEDMDLKVLGKSLYLKCGMDADMIARVFAEAGKDHYIIKDFFPYFIKALKKQDLL